jgi:aldehyde reductase
MMQSDDLKYCALPLGGGTGRMPALGFGTLIADATETRNATKTALEAGFRHLDCAERYRNEEQVGEASRRNCGIRITARSGSGLHSKRAAPSSKWITSIST